MSRRLLILLAVLALAVGVLTPIAAGAADPDPSDLRVPASALDEIKTSKVQTYIVQMLGEPVVAYEGDVRGYAATKPKPGKKINPNSAAVTKYASFLESRHDKALQKVGGEKIYSYVYTYNGFAAELNGAQASALLLDPDVVAVVPDELLKPDTITTPSFLDLDAEGGIWEYVGGSADAGEGVVIGIVDTGIWPENPSFSDRTGTNPNGKPGKLDYKQIPGWHGRCVPGEEFPASDCNKKVIAAQWFNAGFGGDAAVKALFPNEYASARDGDGHGSHTASTAAGNYGVEVVVDGETLGTASGMAPRARIAVYKVCWGGTAGGCFSSDSVAAIDQAVADGVDVINFSISGSRTSYLDPVEVAFLFAADAGVFVAASAGNSGPGASTVAHNSPWLTTVAAGTHDRYYEGTVELGDGTSLTGAMIATGPVSGDLVYGGDVGLDPGSLEAKQCRLGSLDPAMVEGKIVLCDRGAVARVDKSLEVFRNGGIGMIHANTAPNSVNADLHFVPTIHLDHIDGEVARLYTQTEEATATLAGGHLVIAEAPDVAVFSSRGPALASGDLLKPDIMAPGVDIIAAVAPPFDEGRSFDSYSGTSMSSPHIAGIAALMKDAHPDWSPMMIKSALMTTASLETNEGNPIYGTPYDFGAGHVAPNAATDPGLVYDAGWIDWLGFLCGTGQLQALYCPDISIDPSDLNYPSISIGQLAGMQTVTRTVTNVGPSATYKVMVDAPEGINVTVSPDTLKLKKGESASYEVTFTVTPSAALDQPAFGSLTWEGKSYSVRSPIVVTPVAIAAPDEVHGMGTDGSLSFDVTFGYAGDYAALASGMVPADMWPDTVVDDPANDMGTALGTCDWNVFPFQCTGITWHAVNVAPNSDLLRISLFDDYTDGQDDLDLYVWDGNFNYVGGSGSGTSAEEVNIPEPGFSVYFVAVHGWQTDGPDANYTLFSWAFGPDMGNLTITAPDTAVLGETATIQLAWMGLDAGTKYLGAVNHTNGTDVIGTTIVRIDTD